MFKKKIIYIHVPKSGGTTLRHMLNDSFRQQIPVGHLHLTDYERKYENLENYIKISSIRNPWDKMVSLYFFRKDVKKRNLSDFNTWMQYWYNERKFGESKNPDFVNQLDFMKNSQGQVDVDYFIKVENLEEDAKNVLRKIIKPKYAHLVDEVHIPKKNSTKHLHYSHYYNDQSRELVEKYFKDDIEYFKYVFENEDV